MKKITRRSFLKASGLLAASAALASGLTACGGSSASSSVSNGSIASSNNSGKGHPVITINAPYRNMSLFYDLVKEKYPDINLEIEAYNGQNTSAYVKNMRISGKMPDIYFTTYYTPGRMDDENDFLDLSSYDFTGNFTQSRLRDVTLNGGVYMLPVSYTALGITYNKTLLEKNGWELPTSLQEVETLKEKVEAAGCELARAQLQYPGYGFQYLCSIASTGFLSTIDGLVWQEKFLNGEANVSDTPEMVENLQVVQRYRDLGILNGNGTPMNDSQTKDTVGEGNVLFLLGNSNDMSTPENDFRLLPYLSEDGSQNVFILNVSRYFGLNKQLTEPGSEQKLEDALHVMEVLSTMEGLECLDSTQNNARLFPLKEFTVDADSYYVDMIDDLNSGHTAAFIYSGWENIAVVLGNKVIDFACGNASLEDVIQCFDDNQYLITENIAPAYTTATEEIPREDCARAVGIGFGQAVGAQAALISLNVWNYNADPTAKMNTYGVSGRLFPLPVSDEEIVSIIPTGWHNDIFQVTLSGKRIKELAETGYDYYGNGSNFPYVLVTKGGKELDDDTLYTIPICGATEDVQAEGNYTDSGVLGLDAMRTYFEQFETFSKDDIVWE